ncbi:hypothetical protein FKM82_022815 [Ascaphus truei]
MERIFLDVIHTPSVEFILGLPWLQRHNPLINWSDERPITWNTQCATSCAFPVQQICSLKTPVEEQSTLPEVYLNFRDVFDKAKSEVLPPHHTF